MRKLLGILILVALLIGQAAAAWIQLSGFETGDTSEKFSSSGVTIVTSPAYTGTYALRTQTSGFYRFRGLAADGSVTLASVATSYVRVRFRYATAPASGSEDIVACNDTSSGLKGYIRLDSTAHLLLYNDANVVKATSSTALSSGTWYTITWTIPTTALGTSTFNIYDAAGSSLIETATSTTSGWGTLNAGQFVLGPIDPGVATVDFFFDDFAWRDDAEPNPRGRVYCQLPIANSASNTGWTASAGNKFDCVNELPPNADTAYISTSSSGAAYTATLTTTATLGISGTIAAVKQVQTIRDEGGSSAFQMRLRSGGSNSDSGTNIDPGSAYVLTARMMAVDPTDSAAWTTAKLDAVEIGPLCGAAVASRCTFTALMVEVQPSTSPKSQGTMTGIGLALVRGGVGEIADERRRAA